MRLFIRGTPLILDAKDVVAKGGEGLVAKLQQGRQTIAVKVYHTPSPFRARKLTALMSYPPLLTLPANRVAIPIDLVEDASRAIVGLTMPFLGAGIEDVAQLSNRKYRNSAGTTTRQVTDVFIDGHGTLSSIHAANMVIGDLSDSNVLFRLGQMLFIEVDCFQFLNHPCIVATEQFVAPELYGIDLERQSSPIFKPEYDWYSFAVMLFKSLLLVHPFGGVHQKVRRLTHRVQSGITVFDSQVKYPKIALTPDLLNDDLAHAFDEIFAKGKRGVFPLAVLERYAQTLVECDNCGTWYPGTRHNCPVCSAQTLVIITQPTQTTTTKGVSATELIRTAGPIIYSKVIGRNIYLIAIENGKTVLYSKEGAQDAQRRELFNAINGARYEILDHLLIINPPNTEELLVVDISSNTPKPMIKLSTNLFAITRRAIFRTSGRHFFRMAGTSLLVSDSGSNLSEERYVRDVVPNQTWFVADNSSDTLHLFGFHQVMQDQLYWYHVDGHNFEPKLEPLNTHETLVDIMVRFSSSGIVIRRLTQENGVDYIRTELINQEGEVEKTNRMRREDHPTPAIHNQTFSDGSLLHATDDGIVQEKIATGAFKTFAGTEVYVGSGDRLYKYGRGNQLLVINGSSVTLIEIS